MTISDIFRKHTLLFLYLFFPLISSASDFIKYSNFPTANTSTRITNVFEPYFIKRGLDGSGSLYKTFDLSDVTVAIETGEIVPTVPPEKYEEKYYYWIADRDIYKLRIDDGELWKVFDGSRYSSNNILGGRNVSRYTRAGDVLIFAFIHPDLGWEFATFDMSDDTFKFHDVIKGAVGSNPSNFAVIDDDIIFSASFSKDDSGLLYDTSHIYSLDRTLDVDSVRLTGPGDFSRILDGVTHLVNYRDTIYFVTASFNLSGSQIRELWKLNGSTPNFIGFLHENNSNSINFIDATGDTLYIGTGPGDIVYRPDFGLQTVLRADNGAPYSVRDPYSIKVTQNDAYFLVHASYPDCSVVRVEGFEATVLVEREARCSGGLGLFPSKAGVVYSNGLHLESIYFYEDASSSYDDFGYALITGEDATAVYFEKSANLYALSLDDPIELPIPRVRPFVFGDPDPSEIYDSAILIAHGWNSDANSWVQDLAHSICERYLDQTINALAQPDSVIEICDDNGVHVYVIDWSSISGPFPFLTPWDARLNAKPQGEILGVGLARYDYDHVHLIAHSAGSQLIDSIAEVLVGSGSSTNAQDNAPTIHQTFLDAYYDKSITAINLKYPNFNRKGLGVSPYGQFADWVDNYYDTRVALPVTTGVGIDNTKNLSIYGRSIDVTNANPTVTLNPISNHAWPYEFYSNSVGIENQKSGFGLSQLAQREQHGAHATVDLILESDESSEYFMKNCVLVTAENPIYDCIKLDDEHWATWDVVPFKNIIRSAFMIIDTSLSGVVQELINDAIVLKLQNNQQLNSRNTNTFDSEASPIVWTKMTTQLSESANRLSFDVTFTEGSDTLLSIFLNGEVVSQIDQRVTQFDMPISRKDVVLRNPLSDTVMIGLRIDGYSNSESAVTVSNIEFYDTPSFIGKLLKHNTWNQIAIPAAIAEGLTVAQLFGDELPIERYGSEWIVYGYDAAINGYQDLGAAGSMEQGRGYWMLQATGKDVTVYVPNDSEATPALLDTTCALDSCFSIPFLGLNENARWNMMGYPYSASQSFELIRIATESGLCADGCDIATAKENELVYDRIWNYNPSSRTYNELGIDDLLEPWTGFWISPLSRAASASPEIKIPNR